MRTDKFFFSLNLSNNISHLVFLNIDQKLCQITLLIHVLLYIATCMKLTNVVVNTTYPSICHSFIPFNLQLQDHPKLYGKVDKLQNQLFFTLHHEECFICIERLNVCYVDVAYLQVMLNNLVQCLYYYDK
jgi:hypothetical protein